MPVLRPSAFWMPAFVAVSFAPSRMASGHKKFGNFVLMGLSPVGSEFRPISSLPIVPPDVVPGLPTWPTSCGSTMMARAALSPLVWRCGPRPWQM